MKFRKFNRGDYMETERKTHVKMHKSGKNRVTTVMSQLKFLNIFGNHLSQINQVSDEDNHSMRSLSYHTAKSVMTIGAFIGGGAIFTPHVQAEELPAVKELDHETLGQAESEILSGSEKTSTSETSNSRSEATSQSLKSEYDQKSEDISQSEQMSNSQSESLSISESTSESLSMTVSDSVKYSQSEGPSSADSSVSIYSDSLNNSSSISSNTLSKSNMESDSNSSLETLSETDSRDTTSESQINGSQISDSTQSTANHVINEKEQVSQATDLGYLYQFEGNTKDKLANNDAVILTNSDQIIGLDLLAKNLPNLTIHVASVTEMSPKLLSFEQFSNISLYPNANIATIKQLMERASWYLDVNRGNELLNAVREAFNYQLITASFTETYHNAKFTSDQLIIDANQIDELCQVIQTAQDNLEFKAALLAEQKSSSSPNDSRKIS